MNLSADCPIGRGSKASTDSFEVTSVPTLDVTTFNSTYFINSMERPVVETSDYIYVWVTVVNIIIFLVGVVGNIMVILVIIKVRDMRTTTNYFLVNLSVADLLVLLICQPSALLEFYAKDRWYIGEAMCKMIPLLENAVIHASILTILAITIERFYAICFPLKKTLKFYDKTVVKIVALIWVVAYIAALPFIFMTVLEDAEFYDGTPIKVCRTRVAELWHFGYIFTILTVFFILPFLVLTVMYSKIIRCLINDSASILSRKNPCSLYYHRTRRQVVRMLVGIVLLFFISMFPLRVVTLWLIYTPTAEVESMGIDAYLNLLAFCRAMLYLNSAGNPVIYSLASSKFKLAFQRILGRYSPSMGHRLYKNTRKNIVCKPVTVRRFTTNDSLEQPTDHSRRVCIEITFHSL